MKINNKNLQRLYKSYVWEKVPSSRKSCPKLKKIIGSFSTKSPERHKTKIIDHITNCHYCAQEFEFILHTLRYEMKTNKEITNFLSEKVISNLKKKVDATISNLKKGQRSFFPGLSWKYALLLLAGITFIIIAIISFKTISFQSQERNNQRGKSGIQIKLIDPIGSKPLKKFLLFKWSKCKDTDYYILDLFNEALSPIWTSEKIYENYFNFSNHETKKLVRNKVYFWMVTALFPEGRKIESPLQKFILTY